jgi:hypothetical protein
MKMETKCPDNITIAIHKVTISVIKKNTDTGEQSPVTKYKAQLMWIRNGGPTYVAADEKAPEAGSHTVEFEAGESNACPEGLCARINLRPGIALVHDHLIGPVRRDEVLPFVLECDHEVYGKLE